MTWGFQFSYYSSSWLKRLQNCDLSKFEVRKNCLLWCCLLSKILSRQEFFSDLELWQIIFLLLFELCPICTLLKKIIAALLRYVILAQTNPIYVVCALACCFQWQPLYIKATKCLNTGKVPTTLRFCTFMVNLGIWEIRLLCGNKLNFLVAYSSLRPFPRSKWI